MFASIREYFRSYERRLEVAERHTFLVGVATMTVIVAPFAFLFLIGTHISIRIWIAGVVVIVVFGAAINSYSVSRKRRRRS